jgi:uncharacterized membrane protein YdjX (TVP38/TMEM64 family)
MAQSGHSLVRGLLAAAVAVALVVAWTHRDLFDQPLIRGLILDHRAAIRAAPYAPLVFILVHVFVSLTFIPRTIVAVAAGAIWGLWWGTVLATLGGLAGASAGFFIARYLNGGRIDPNRLPGFGRLLGRLERGGWRAVTLLRLVPVMPHTPVNYAFGLTRVKFLPYVVGTVLGLLPTTVFYVDLGVVGERVAAAGQWHIPVLIGIAALAISLLAPRLPGLRRPRD